MKGWLDAVQLQEQAGVGVTLTAFTMSGTDFSSVMANTFGSTRLAARGTLTANLGIQWSPLPSTVVFGFSGVDAAGTTWTQSAPVATNSLITAVGK